MQYRFTLAQETLSVRRQTPAYEVFDLPRGGRWPANWEWTYDFPDIKKDLQRDFHWLLAGVALRVLRWCGAIVRRGVPEYARSAKYVQVDSQRAIDAILSKLDNLQKHNLYEGSMILVGPKECSELLGLADTWGPVQFIAQKEYGYSQTLPSGARETGYYMLSIPIVVLPDFVGVAVVPDFTRTASKRLLDRYIMESARDVRILEKQIYTLDEGDYEDEYGSLFQY